MSAATLDVQIASDAQRGTHWQQRMVEHRGYCAIGLHKAKTPENIGNVLRAAGCYGAAMVGVSGSRYRPHATDTLKAWRHMPLIEVADLKTIVPYDCVPVAVELLPHAKPLQNYHHPERAFYIFGPEDGSLGQEVTGWCRDVVSVPTVFCMNLAACVNVLLYDRLAKQARAMRNEKLCGREPNKKGQ